MPGRNAAQGTSPAVVAVAADDAANDAVLSISLGRIHLVRFLGTQHEEGLSARLVMN